MVAAMRQSSTRHVIGLANRPESRRAPNPRPTNQTALAVTAPTPNSHRSSRCSLAKAPRRTTVSRYTCGFRNVSAAHVTSTAASRAGATSDGVNDDGPPRALGRQQAVADEEGGAAELGDVQRAGVGADQRADACDARGDQHHVRQGAHGHDGQHVLAADALAQDERVLRTDGGDQGERRQESDDEWGVHAPKLGSGFTAVQLMILHLH